MSMMSMIKKRNKEERKTLSNNHKCDKLFKRKRIRNKLFSICCKNGRLTMKVKLELNRNNLMKRKKIKS